MSKASELSLDLRKRFEQKGQVSSEEKTIETENKAIAIEDTATTKYDSATSSVHKEPGRTGITISSAIENIAAIIFGIFGIIFLYLPFASRENGWMWIITWPLGLLFIIIALLGLILAKKVKG